MNSEHATPHFETTPQPYGHIKSFVRGRGHLTPSQAQAIETSYSTWGIDFEPNTPLNHLKTFGRNAPTWLEIGFGMGETTIQIAHNHPDVNYIAVEVYPAGIGSLLKQIKQHNINNIRIVWHDAMEVIQHMIADQSLDQIMIFFPDPWRKKKHHKRRLIRPEFIRQLSQKIKPAGRLHCATDWQNYAEHMLAVLVEAAVRNTILQLRGIDTYQEFIERHQKAMLKASE